MKALAGLRIVVTRAQHQAEELAQPLRERGANVILLPVIGIAAPNDPEPLCQAARSEAYEWIIFTSANAVAAFASEIKKNSRPCTARIATVGAATREAAEAHGFTVQLVPEKYVVESLVDAFVPYQLRGSRFLIPSAALTRDVIAPALRKLGAQVDVVEAYRNIVPPEAAEQAQSVFRTLHPDWVTFASSSAAANLWNLVGAEVLRRSKIASIGPVTSETVSQLGLTVNAEANPHTIEGLVEALIAAQLH